MIIIIPVNVNGINPSFLSFFFFLFFLFIEKYKAIAASVKKGKGQIIA